MAMNPNTLSQDDQQVVNVAKRDGIAILPDLLTPAEVDLVRQDFDQLHIDLGKGPGTPGVRDSLSGDKLLPYGHVAALFSIRVLWQSCAPSSARNIRGRGS